jgi:hypothetical protein
MSTNAFVPKVKPEHVVSFGDAIFAFAMEEQEAATTTATDDSNDNGLVKGNGSNKGTAPNSSI